VTTPAWAVLFPIAGALVTDGGGVLSHAAIIALEHGVPAVLGTRSGTSRLEAGQFVEVDGTAGVARVL
jgi:pyruvate,water dikinase